jgi:hypothetical protein
MALAQRGAIVLALAHFQVQALPTLAAKQCAALL